jgi:tetratricopeptide (TPR) repeat protein
VSIVGDAGLLTLALADPRSAIGAARAVLAGKPGPGPASFARQALGIALRETGEVAAGVRELRVAVRLARATGDAGREVDVLASLGATLGRAGHAKEGLATLDSAVRRSRGPLAGRVLLRRADVLIVLGRHREALDDLRGALSRLQRAGDKVWEARCHAYRGFVRLALGDVRRADDDFAASERLYAETRQQFEYAQAIDNRGLAAFARGDLPTALSYLDEAGRLFDGLGVIEPNLQIDRCGVLLAAGLAREAVREADQVAVQMARTGVPAAKRAELLFVAARAALAAGDAGGAERRAKQALRLFQRQHRDSWAARAALVVAEAQYETGDHTAALLRRVEALAEALGAAGAAEAPSAHLLAGRLALHRRRPDGATRHLDRAAAARRAGPPLARSAGWLAQALRAEASGRFRSVLPACARGLDALDEHLLTLGATELRAHATGHGTELAQLAQRHALRRGDARQLLAWSERWRATALAVPPVRPPDDRELVAELAALRSVTRRIDAGLGEPVDVRSPADRAATAILVRERNRLEAAVRTRTRRARRPARSRPARPFDEWFAELRTALGGSPLVELIDVDGTLHAVVVARGRTRCVTVGPTADASREIAMALFRLRQLAHGRPSAAASGVPLERVGERLQHALLGPVAALLSDAGAGPVVIVPPGRLHAVPWSLMPVLRDRPVSVAPSAATWLRARRQRPPKGHRIALVFGPDLGTGGAEVPQLARRYRGATVLGRGTATAERVLTALDGAWLAHVAAHGSFRSDSPLFSALRLDDGPLTVHDFERLGRAPYRLVLSSCESGVGQPVGADELLGLITGLVPLGAAGILASVVPVNDPAAVPLMLRLHAELDAGADLPTALARARAVSGTDPVATATALSFIALGV